MLSSFSIKGFVFIIGHLKIVKKVLGEIFISLIIITTIGCTSSAISNNPDPKEIERVAEEAFKELDDKVEGANDDEIIIEMQESDEQVNNAPVKPIINWDI